MRSTVGLAASILTATILHTVPTMAEDEKPKEVTTKELTNVETKAATQDGLAVSLRTGIVGSLSTADSVFGQLDGTSYNFGIKMDGNATYKNSGHEWRNILALNTAVAQTPAIDALIKSADTLVVDSTYLYFVRDWFGPFVRVSASMPILRGFDVRPGTTDYSIARVSGETDLVVGRTGRFDLTDPFRPATLKQTVGPFVRPFRSEKFMVEARVGIGGLQILADKQLAIQDKPDTLAVEVQELQTVLQVGGEAALDIDGVIFDKRLRYKLGAAVLSPFWSNAGAGNDKSLLELTNVDLGGSVSIKIFEWATLDYTFRLQRQPQLTEQWQTRQGVSISVGPSFERKPPKPPAKEPAKPAAEAPVAAPAAK